MIWTDARVAELARLWAEGVSASGIADALGEVSRSAVLGKLHRLKLLGSRQPASTPKRYDGRAAMPPSAAVAQPVAWSVARRCGPAAPPPAPKAPWREAAFTPLAGTSPRHWLTREFGECAFPVAGDGEGLRSCCAAARSRSAYCAAHHAIAFKPVVPSTRAAEERQWARAAERWAA